MQNEKTKTQTQAVINHTDIKFLTVLYSLKFMTLKQIHQLLYFNSDYKNNGLSYLRKKLKLLETEGYITSINFTKSGGGKLPKAYFIGSKGCKIVGEATNRLRLVPPTRRDKLSIEHDLLVVDSYINLNNELQKDKLTYELLGPGENTLSTEKRGSVEIKIQADFTIITNNNTIYFEYDRATENLTKIKRKFQDYLKYFNNNHLQLSSFHHIFIQTTSIERANNIKELYENVKAGCRVQLHVYPHEQSIELANLIRKVNEQAVSLESIDKIKALSKNYSQSYIINLKQKLEHLFQTKFFLIKNPVYLTAKYNYEIKFDYSLEAAKNIFFIIDNNSHEKSIKNISSNNLKIIIIIDELKSNEMINVLGQLGERLFQQKNSYYFTSPALINSDNYKIFYLFNTVTSQFESHQL